MGYLISGTRSRSTEEINERAARAASGFSALGLMPGDAVALYLRNDFPLFEASFGAGLIGAYSVPVNWHYVEEEARYLFADARPKVIIVHADLLAGIRNALPESATVFVVPTPPEIRDAYGISPDRCSVPPGMNDWDTWLMSNTPRTAAPAQAPDVMIYTSGTTGRPKGVRRKAPTAAESQFQDFIRARGFGFSREHGPEIVTVVTGPMYHNAPYAYGTLAARYGGTVILQPRFNGPALLELIARHRVTHLHMVPVMFNRLLDIPPAERRKANLSSLKFVVHAAAPVAPQVKREMLDWWGPVISEYYGTTETGMMAYCTAEQWLAHPGTVGKVLPEADLRIVGQDGRDMPPGVPGEIQCWVRGNPDFTYHNDDGKRDRSFHGNRFMTGDVGYVDEEGFLYLCDRVKDMLISGGVNIYPAEIEAELCRMPGVKDCAVFGIPDKEFGEAVCAVVQPHGESRLSEKQVREFLAGRIAGYKMPRVVHFRDVLPREDSGKIFKRKIREEFWVGQERAI